MARSHGSIGPSCWPAPDMNVIDGDESPKRAKIGSVLSIIAMALYVITYVTLMIDPGISIPFNFFTFLLMIAFAPLIMFFAVIGTIVSVMLFIGVMLIIAGKSKPGGIIVIVFSCIGIFFAAFCYFIPLGLGIAGGVLSILHK